MDKPTTPTTLSPKKEGPPSKAEEIQERITVLQGLRFDILLFRIMIDIFAYWDPFSSDLFVFLQYRQEQNRDALTKVIVTSVMMFTVPPLVYFLCFYQLLLGN